MNTLPLPASLPASSPHTSPILLRVASRHATALLTVLLAFLLSGCTTTATDRAAKLLASTVQTVDVAMQSYSAAYVLGSVPADEHQKVLRIYADYQAAEAVAELAIKTAMQTGDAGSLASATAALDASKFELLAFVARFTTSPPKQL